MSLRITISSFVAVIVILSCSSSRILPTNTEGERIEFGKGGGFAGIEDRFVLHETGFLMKKVMGSDSLTLIHKLDNNHSKQIFANYELLSLNEIELNDPGNIYKFIYKYDEGKEHKLVWHGKTVHNNLNLFYQNLNALIIIEN